MRKIPTLFKRDPDDMRHVLPEVTPGCEWVLAGEGVATRKYDGTCVMFDGSDWWARREVKPGKPDPQNFRLEDHDIVTGKSVGWVPLEQSGFGKFHAEAIGDGRIWEGAEPNTYELCGPKINGNPEHLERHTLILHGADSFPQHEPPRDLAGLREWLIDNPYEGIVWHHPDGRMAKLKKRDFA
jgi:hypothetical protein